LAKGGWRRKGKEERREGGHSHLGGAQIEAIDVAKKVREGVPLRRELLDLAQVGRIHAPGPGHGGEEAVGDVEAMALQEGGREGGKGGGREGGREGKGEGGRERKVGGCPD
jgi:hypothetical protein